jgi:O-antigen ligase
MSQKTYLAILKGGIFLCFLSVFFVFKNLLFPYITSKQIYFNILVEILFVFWIGFIVKYPEWRPKKNWITIGLTAFFITITMSAITGVDFVMSFWGNIERMLGIFHLLHFFFFYLIIITVFRSWKDWKWLLIIATATGTLVGLHGIAQHYEIIKSPWGSARIIATIGNAAYVGAYAIFMMYFAGILMFREKNWVLRSVYILVIIINFFTMIFSGTRGAIYGFAASLFLISLFYGLLNQNKRIKLASIGVLVALVLIFVTLFAMKNNPAVANNVFLGRMTNVSLSDPTMHTRLLSWKAAWKDFPHHPLLGTGWGNYAITFDKYFDPIFLSYTSGETYFDRAHNNLVDITSTSGILGIATYFFFFGAVVYYLIIGYRKKNITLADFSLIIGLVAAYFIQNLFVFDSLVTYISLMVLLGYILYLSQGDEYNLAKNKPIQAEGNKEFVALVIAGILSLIVMYQYNIKVYNMLDATIMGQQYASQGDILNVYNYYKKASDYDTVLNRDSRNTYIRVISSSLDALQKIDKKKAQEIIDFAISEGEKNIKNNPYDSLMQMQQAQLYDTVSRYYYNDKEKFAEYNSLALDAINKSIKASPGRMPIYFYQAQIYMARGDKNKAIDSLKYAASLNANFPESFCQLARVYFFYKMDKEGYETMDKCVDGGAPNLQPAELVKQLVNHYLEKKDWKKIINLMNRLTVIEPGVVKNWIDLARLYEQQGDYDSAITAAKQAITVDATLKDSGAQYIAGLEQKKKGAGK